MNKQQAALVAGFVYLAYHGVMFYRREQEVRADWNLFNQEPNARNLVRLALAETALVAELAAALG